MSATVDPDRGRTMSPDHPPRMRAVVRRRYGGVEEVHLDELAVPAVGRDEVLVEVRAAALDRGTWHTLTGVPYAARLAFGLRAPRNPVLGRDVAGVIAAVGDRVTEFAPGDRVYGTADGSFAEYAVARPRRLAPAPVALDDLQAAAVPVSGLTALQGVVDAGRVEAGQRVLVIGSSGGVGTYAVQIAKAFGAEVTGVCSTGKVDLVRSLGADHVVDHTRVDVTDGEQRFDLILDIGGGARLARLRGVLAPRGTLVIVGSDAGDRWLGIGRQLRAVVWSPFVRQRLVMLVSRERSVDLRRLTDLIDRGAVVPAIERTFTLAEVPDAVRHLTDGRARGKLVIDVSPRPTSPSWSGSSRDGSRES